MPAAGLAARQGLHQPAAYLHLDDPCALPADRAVSAQAFVQQEGGERAGPRPNAGGGTGVERLRLLAALCRRGGVSAALLTALRAGPAAVSLQPPSAGGGSAPERPRAVVGRSDLAEPDPRRLVVRPSLISKM
ncbi:hypothetical protein AERO8C_140245 [Aeromonas veronii]|uniref:Uncharacterized protein n=1 Tax=Aeromonas veronii TaxID=654 RepID=A0A653KVQ7_AERVE|nr:hypothetical protein AERO8C_140245 [Aeromonas veronii]